MRYYLIAGEASGDLHASHLMMSLRNEDPDAQFRFFGGDLMQRVGGTLVKHYREMAFMGFVPVLMHLPEILKNMKICRADILQWHPDVVILVDYPGFNLKIAKFLKTHTDIPAYYYISPKIWAWKEYRIKSIKRDVNELFSILPFEVDFFEGKHHFPVHYVGNPTVDEVRQFKETYAESLDDFTGRNGLDRHKPIIALLAGSRKQEIKDNLPAMIEAANKVPGYQIVLAGAPSVDDSWYNRFLSGSNVSMVKNQTYALLSHATAALVTSGTATLETALLDVPQVVCYKTPVPPLVRFAFNHVMTVKYISLVNLIADKEIVPELFADRFTVSQIVDALQQILPNHANRSKMLQGYADVAHLLGDKIASKNAAQLVVRLLQRKH